MKSFVLCSKQLRYMACWLCSLTPYCSRKWAYTPPPLIGHSDLDAWRGHSGLHRVAEIIEAINKYQLSRWPKWRIYLHVLLSLFPKECLDGTKDRVISFSLWPTRNTNKQVLFVTWMWTSLNTVWIIFTQSSSERVWFVACEVNY